MISIPQTVAAGPAPAAQLPPNLSTLDSQLPPISQSPSLDTSTRGGPTDGPRTGGSSMDSRPDDHDRDDNSSIDHYTYYSDTNTYSLHKLLVDGDSLDSASPILRAWGTPEMDEDEDGPMLIDPYYLAPYHPTQHKDLQSWSDTLLLELYIKSSPAPTPELAPAPLHAQAPPVSMPRPAAEGARVKSRTAEEELAAVAVSTEPLAATNSRRERGPAHGHGQEHGHGHGQGQGQGYGIKAALPMTMATASAVPTVAVAPSANPVFQGISIVPQSAESPSPRLEKHYLFQTHHRHGRQSAEEKEHSPESLEQLSQIQEKKKKKKGRKYGFASSSLPQQQLGDDPQPKLPKRRLFRRLRAGAKPVVEYFRGLICTLDSHRDIEKEVINDNNVNSNGRNSRVVGVADGDYGNCHASHPATATTATANKSHAADSQVIQHATAAANAVATAATTTTTTEQQQGTVKTMATPITAKEDSAVQPNSEEAKRGHPHGRDEIAAMAVTTTMTTTTSTVAQNRIQECSVTSSPVSAERMDSATLPREDQWPTMNRVMDQATEPVHESTTPPSSANSNHSAAPNVAANIVPAVGLLETINRAPTEIEPVITTTAAVVEKKEEQVIPVSTATRKKRRDRGGPRLHPKLVELYEITDHVLGVGTFATVKEIKLRSTGKSFALKIILKTTLQGKGAMLDTEIAVLSKVRHLHCVSLLEMFETEDAVYLVTDLAEGGELFEQILQKGSYTEGDAARLVREILLGVEYLHGMDIVHRDLKPENLLFFDKSENARLMITDFGLSKILTNGNDVLMTACGTPGYVAPEVLGQLGHGKPVDIWSVGVISYILLCGYTPFYGEDQTALFHSIMSGAYDYEEEYWKDISVLAKSFISSLLVVQADARPTAAQALNHPWFRAMLDQDLIAPASPQDSVNLMPAVQRNFNARNVFKRAVRAVGLLRRIQASSSQQQQQQQQQQQKRQQDQQGREQSPRSAHSRVTTEGPTTPTTAATTPGQSPLFKAAKQAAVATTPSPKSGNNNPWAGTIASAAGAEGAEGVERALPRKGTTGLTFHDVVNAALLSRSGAQLQEDGSFDLSAYTSVSPTSDLGGKSPEPTTTHYQGKKEHVSSRQEMESLELVSSVLEGFDEHLVSTRQNGAPSSITPPQSTRG